MNSENSISREQKLKTIGLPIDYNDNEVTDEALDAIYNKIITINKKNDLVDKQKGSICIKKSKFDKVANDSDIYMITLFFLNDLLKVFNKPEIMEINQFRDIDRADIIKPICNVVLDKHLNNIIKKVGKSKIRYNDRLHHKYYVLTVIKYLANYCGYEFSSNRICHFIKKQGDDYTYTKIVHYHIK